MIKFNNNNILYYTIILFLIISIAPMFIFLEDINDKINKFYFAPILNSQFGFESGKVKINYKKIKYEMFTLKNIKKGSIFETAGFKENDVPINFGCRFNLIGKSDESLFYNNLVLAKNGNNVTFLVINIKENSTESDVEQS